LRSRWRSWLVIALLISVVGGFVLAATAAGRRTDSAFPRFVARYGFDATVYATRPIPQLARLPDVSSATGVLNPSNGYPTCDCTHPINPSDFSVLSEPSSARPFFKLVSGHLPDPSAPDQVLASITLQHDDGVHVGTIIHLPFFSPSQAAAANSSTNTSLKPHGPTVALHVVGLVVSPFDFPSGEASSYEIYTTPAFTRTIIPHTAAGLEYAVRLRGGTADLPRFDSEANRLDKAGVEGVGNLHGQTESIEGSIHPQAIGWFILAALAALVGLTVIGQALSRQSVVESRDYPTLTALGADQRQLVILGMARNLILALAGAAGAVVLAIALSPLAPVGEARLAESSSGLSVDAFVCGVGALAIILVVLALGVWPAIRAALPTHKDDRVTTIRHSAIVTGLAAAGAPPTALIGVRNALQRRTSGAIVPVGTAFLGTVLAVVALCGTAVFGSSLAHLTATPALYGDPYQLVFDVIPGLPDPALLTTLTHDRHVDVITRAVAGQVSIDNSTVGALAIAPLRGSIPFSTVDGHLPGGNGQIGLGAATMRQVHAHVGSLINVTVSTPAGGKLTRPFRVVSQVPLPVVGGYVGLGNGALFTISGYQAAACPPGSDHRNACQMAVVGSSFGALVTKMSPGPQGEATVVHYLKAYPFYASPPVTPTSLINFGEAINFPLIFGAIVAIFGAATIAHLLVVSVSRRRRETGLLKVLGFTNRQVLSAVAWQATTLTLVGLVIGIPVGLIAGSATWKFFAGQIGVVPIATVPVWLVVAIAGGVIVITNLLATGPALVAMRTKPGRLMYGQQ
jgi:FtsX-like permease family